MEEVPWGQSPLPACPLGWLDTQEALGARAQQLRGLRRLHSQLDHGGARRAAAAVEITF